MNRDFFKNKADDYEQNTKRVNNVEKIAQCIKNEIALDDSMEIMDFGSGTGLLLERIAPMVGKMVAVDMSSSMNKKMADKKDEIECEIEMIEVDLSKEKLDRKFDAIISSMTIHHVADVEKLFRDFYDMLEAGGAIALADLDSEDGSFHTEDTGVHHLGFDRGWIMDIANRAGFRNVKIQDASVAQKPYGDFPIFLLTGIK